MPVPAGAGVPDATPRAEAPQRSKPIAAIKQALTLPLEIGKGDWTVILLAMMMFFAPALGVPNEEMLQDTLKSIVVSFLAVSAALILFWRQRNRRDALRWHFIMWLPIGLMAYALGSMVWSHTYLGGVEAIRWFIFSLILWMGLNTLSRERLPTLAWGIHFGAVVASLWTVLQFWADLKYFPQGPNPASTFVNRNFFGEFLACTLPFTILLLARARQSASIFLMAFSLAFNIIAILMTGTRSALVATWMIVVLMPIVLFIYRKQFAIAQWDSGKRIICIGVILATVVGLGMIQTGNASLVEEQRTMQRGLTPLQRGLGRTASIAAKEEFTERSFSIRLIMWKATAHMITKRPLSGVGAGAWEVDLPLYQSEGSQLETDYYVHNEILQLLAEYGLVGWIFLILLLSYLSWSAWKTWRMRDSPEDVAEAPYRAIALVSLFGFLLVSNAGFPWRMASTGTLFALNLAILAASDARLGLRGFFLARRIDWRPAYSQGMAVAMMICLVLTAYISQQAAECEAKIVRAVKMALTISQSGDPNNPRFDKTKTEMFRLLREGVAINPHYRKITPMVADEVAKWGDWKDAVWIWESVISSRPYVVAILSNIARGYVQLGDNPKALEVLYRAKKLQPNAPSVRSLEVILLSRTGKEPEALALSRQYLKDDLYDFDLVSAAYVLGVRAKDYKLAIRAMELRNKSWPAQEVDGLMKIANIYAGTEEAKDEAKALQNYKAAIAAAPDAEKAKIRAQVPTVYQGKL